MDLAVDVGGWRSAIWKGSAGPAGRGSKGHGNACQGLASLIDHGQLQILCKRLTHRCRLSAARAGVHGGRDRHVADQPGNHKVGDRRSQAGGQVVADRGGKAVIAAGDVVKVRSGKLIHGRLGAVQRAFADKGPTLIGNGNQGGPLWRRRAGASTTCQGFDCPTES